MGEKNSTMITLSSDELEGLLKRLEDSNEKQARYAKKQYRMSQLTALAGILILAVTLYTSSILIPKMSRLFDDMETVMTSVNEVSRELTNTNLKQMVDDIDHLVTSSDQSVQDALEQINSIDISTLNEAIQDLADIVRPLARLFGK